jgi:ankyrin repeat protein
MHKAAYAEHPEIVRLLIAAGAAIDSVDGMTLTAMHWGINKSPSGNHEVGSRITELT